MEEQVEQVVARRNIVKFMGAAAGLGIGFAILHGAKSTPVPQLDLVRGRAWVDAGAIVLDVRGEKLFKISHIPSAVLMPLDLLYSSIPGWLAAQKDKQVVVYCGDGLTHGPDATRLLVEGGFKHVGNLTAGLEGWEAAGYPLKAG